METAKRIVSAAMGKGLAILVVLTAFVVPAQAAPKPERLTTPQLRAMERLFQAGVATNRPRATPRAAALYARRCDGLGGRGSVLSAYQRLCAPVGRDLVFTNRGCDSGRSCRRQFAFSARSARALLRAAPGANAELAQALASGPCRRELTFSPGEVRAERARKAYVVKAARLYGRVPDARLRRIYKRKAARIQEAPSPQEQLRGLRRHCS